MRSTVLAGVVAALLFVGVGCESSNSARADQNNGYAGGNGAFGENPVQPGEYSQQRFDRDRDVPSGNLQGGREVH